MRLYRALDERKPQPGAFHGVGTKFEIAPKRVNGVKIFYKHALVDFHRRIPESERLLVPPKDIAALAEAILRVLNNEMLRKRLALAGRQSIEQKLNIQKITQEYQKLFCELII